MTAPLRRLMKEAAELNTSPSPHFHAAPISDSNLFEWHFTLAGPPAPSAYAGGIYHGRIVLPATYPLRPPSFRFLTPSGRFEVNREICLSISGHHEELWQPAWGIRTSLLAIRSFMDGDAMGQVGGMDASLEARREYARESADWVCEVCGRANGVILGEWREECRGMGVEVDDEGEGVSTGVGDVSQGDTQNSGDGGDGPGDVKDTTGAAAATSGEQAQQPQSGAEETENAAPVVSSARPTQAAPAPAPATTSTAPPNPASPPPSSSSPAQHPLPRNAPPARSPASPLQAAAAAPPPVPATATQAHSGSAAASQANSNSTPWLDRAIFGLFIALLVMILRRIARDE